MEILSAFDVVKVKVTGILLRPGINLYDVNVSQLKRIKLIN